MGRKQRRVFITGAGSGLGRELALGYARAGNRVAVMDLDPERAMATAGLVEEAGGTPLALTGDVRDQDSLDRLAAHLEQDWDGVDLVVNNAGVAGGGVFEDISLADWDWMIDVNLMGVVRGCRAFVPMLKRQGSGALLNIASMAGLLNPPGMANYNVAKCGVVALSETLRPELDPFGIRVHVACPSFFRTNLMDSFRGPDERMRRLGEKLFDSGRLSAEDVARHIRMRADSGEFLILPHREARIAYRMKRFAPPLFLREMIRFGKKFQQIPG